MPFTYPSIQHRLLANSTEVQFEGVKGPCWVWIGNLGSNGYPRITVRRGGRHLKLYAHRVSYEELKKGVLGPNDTVDHECECTACVNPDHLKAVPNEFNAKLRWLRRR